MLKILVVTDMHYAAPDERSTIAARRGDLTLRLLETLKGLSPECDAVCVLGDIIENGFRDTAPLRWAEFRAVLEGFGKPLFVLPGNHDRRPDAFAEVFGKPAPVKVGDYTIIPFWDHYDEHDVCTRDLDAMEAQLDAAEGSVIVLQHSTILPAIDSAYPYTLPQHKDIAASYTRHGVALSLSGHYHWGIEPFVEDGVTYAAVPAFCESPFRYAVVTVEGHQVDMQVLTLEGIFKE
ncbi:MAG: metallophosphoesterase [Clostridia bacterium]|nr:metallophosphoesterase [Clostridia bacterium]